MAVVNFATIEPNITLLKKVNEYISAGMEMVTDVALDLAECAKGTGGECEEKLKELDDIMLQYADMDREHDRFMAAIDFTKHQAAQNSRDNLVEVLEGKVDELTQQSQSEDLTSHAKYIEMKEKIWEIGHPGESLPAQAAVGCVNTDDMDDDMIMTQEVMNTKCPYLGTEMTNPMKNKLCGHRIDKKGLEALLKTRHRHVVKCPYGGCKNKKPIEMEQYEEDRDMKRLIDRHNRQQGKRTAHTHRVLATP